MWGIFRPKSYRKSLPTSDKQFLLQYATTMSQRTANLLKWVITLCIPFALASFVIGVVIGDWLPSFEYNNRVAPDAFGWEKEERLELALVAVEYLSVRDSAENSIYLLEEQTLPGSNDPLYNEREISHMIDVKHLTDAIRRGGWLLAIISVACTTLLLYRNETEPTAYRAIRNGGYATFAILVGIGLFMAVAWNTFFVQFHELLFPEGSWTFSMTDSLIRLFPEKLWQDVGAFIVGGTFLLGIVCLLVGRWLLKRTEKQKK